MSRETEYRFSYFSWWLIIDFSLCFSIRELEEDPFFTDMYEDSGFGGQEPLLSLPSVRERRNPSAHAQVADIVNRYH